jgi:hypothetical protein
VKHRRQAGVDPGGAALKQRPQETVGLLGRAMVRVQRDQRREVGGDLVSGFRQRRGAAVLGPRRSPAR